MASMSSSLRRPILLLTGCPEPSVSGTGIAMSVPQ